MNQLKRLSNYLKPYKVRLFYALLCMVLVAGMSALSMYLVKEVIDKIFVQVNLNRYQLLNLLVFVILIVFLLKGLAAYGQNYFMAYIGQRIIQRLRNELYAHLHTLSMDFYDRTASGKIISKMTNDINALQMGIVKVPLVLIKDGFTIIAMLFLLFYLHWKFAILTVFVFPLAGIPLVKFGRKIRVVSQRAHQKISDIYSILHETLSGVKVIKSFNMEGYEIKKFEKENVNLYSLIMRSLKAEGLSHPVMEFVVVIGIVLIIWYGGRDVIMGIWTAGSFFAFLGATFSMYQPLKDFASINSIIQQSLSAAERLFELLDEKPTVVNFPNAVKLFSFKREITYNNLSFTYKENLPVLKNINLTIKKGEVVALVGPSGGGKTTIVNLLCRFYDSVEGKILIDGQDIKYVTIESLRSLIGIVTQEVILFNDTVRNNIAYGHPESSIDKVISAGKSANADEFIQKLSHKYETVIGERGVLLSGGQRQRLAIARAVMKNPAILILDEATSSLDSESEALVQEAIDRLMRERTTLVIAHRLSTVINSDRILVIDNGIILDSGKHEELLKRCSLYKKLYDMQFKI